MKTTTAANRGEKGNAEIQINFTKRSKEAQCEFLFAYLSTYGSVTTNYARNELFILGIAARIWELRHEQNKNIATQMVAASPTSRVKIANYVLLPGTHHEVQS